MSDPAFAAAVPSIAASAPGTRLDRRAGAGA